jgi:hypothetical protein
MKRLTINIGFITNSSSVVHWLPKEILQDEEVKAFLDAYGLAGGTVGDDLWRRDTCSSFIVTPEQAEAANEQLRSSEYSAPVEVPVDAVTVIYGDEYSTVFAELSHVLEAAASRLGLVGGSFEYN